VGLPLKVSSSGPDFWNGDDSALLHSRRLPEPAGTLATRRYSKSCGLQHEAHSQGLEMRTARVAGLLALQG